MLQIIPAAAQKVFLTYANWGYRLSLNFCINFHLFCMPKCAKVWQISRFFQHSPHKIIQNFMIFWNSPVNENSEAVQHLYY